MTTLTRVLATDSLTCPFACKYCFAKTPQYIKLKQDLPTLESLSNDDFDVLYPSCDSEYFISKVTREKIYSLLQSGNRRFIVSISTKTSISDRLLDEVVAMDQLLRKEARGFIKLGVSISTKSMIQLVEPGTSTYSDRLRALDLVVSAGMAASINIKPILPHVSASEYLEIVRDTLEFRVPYLLGPLYIDRDTTWGQQVAALWPEMIRERRVLWLTQEPVWPAIVDGEKERLITAEVIANRGAAFTSDSALLATLIPKESDVD